MAGKIQGQDVKTEAELIALGAGASSLPKDSQIFVTALGINKTLDDAITDGDIGGGTPTFPLAAPDGTAAAPSYSFSSDSDSGMFYALAEVAFSYGSAKVWTYNGTNILPASAGSTDLGSMLRRFNKLHINQIGINVSNTERATIGRLQTGATATTANGIFGNGTAEPVAISTDDDAGADAVATANVITETGNKTAGTGNSGDYLVQTGSSVGGLRGRMVVNARTFRLPKHAAAPTATESGEMYYDTTTNKSYTWDGTTWQAHF